MDYGHDRYAFFEAYAIVLLVVIFAKDEKADLTPYDKERIAEVLVAIQQDLDEGRS